MKKFLGLFIVLFAGALCNAQVAQEPVNVVNSAPAGSCGVAPLTKVSNVGTYQCIGDVWTSFATGSGFSGSPINSVAATYQVLAADFSAFKTLVITSGSGAVTLVASGAQPTSGRYINVVNQGSGVVTITRSGQNINGGTATLSLPAGSATAPTSITIVSDGTNYFTSGIAGAATASGISGGTSGQAAIMGSATTVTSSKALAGSGAGITTGPTSSTNTDCANFSGTGGQIADSGAPCGGGLVGFVDPVASYSAAGVTTATTGTIASSSNSLNVTSATGWSVGMGISVANAATGVASITSATGGSVTGPVGSTCYLTAFNNGGTSTIAVATLVTLNTIVGATFQIWPGQGVTSVPTTATLSNGTPKGTGAPVSAIAATPATCSGTATVTTTTGNSTLISSVTGIVGTTFTLADSATQTATTQAVNHDDTAALNTAIASGSNVYIRPGSYNITGSLNVTTSIAIIGSGGGQSFIVNRGTANDVFRVTAEGAPAFALNYPLGPQIKDLTLNQASGITPIAGAGLHVGTGVAAHYTYDLKITNVAMGSLWEGVYHDTGAVGINFTNSTINSPASGFGDYYNTPSPGGDQNIDGLHIQVGSLYLQQSDTNSYTNLKINTGSVFTGSGVIGNVVFLNPSIEQSFACAFDFTASSTATLLDITIVGGEEEATNLYCNRSHALSVANVDTIITIGAGQFPESGGGIFDFFGNVSIESTYNEVTEGLNTGGFPETRWKNLGSVSSTYLTQDLTVGHLGLVNNSTSASQDFITWTLGASPTVSGITYGGSSTNNTFSGPLLGNNGLRVIGTTPGLTSATSGYWCGVTSSEPRCQMVDSTAGADAKVWQFKTDASGNYIIQAVNDTIGAVTNAMVIARTGQTPISVTFNEPLVASTISPASARKGTLTCTSGGTIAVTNSNYATTSDVTFTNKTPGGTVSWTPNINGVTPGTGFTVICATLDTSVYTYDIFN